MKLKCIINPQSGGGSCLKLWPIMEACLKGKNVEYELIQHEGDLSAIIQKILKNLDRENLADQTIIAGLGGDGTHHALINGIMSFRDDNPGVLIPSYAIIPFGTGNNIAKSFGLEPVFGNLHNCIAIAVEAAIDGDDHQVDLGRVDNRWFLDAFTVGIDAHILAGRNRDRAELVKNHFAYRLFKGYPLYLFNTLKSLWICKPLQGQVKVDGENWYSGDFFNLVVNNTAIYAGELDLTDNAPADDGLLDAVIFTGSMDYLRRYLLAHRYLPKKVRSLSSKMRKTMSHIRGKTFEIKLEKPIPCQIDGEELPPGKSFRIETFAGILKIKKLKK